MSLPETAHQQLSFDPGTLAPIANRAPSQPSAAAVRLSVMTSLYGENSYLSQQLNTLQQQVDAWQPRCQPNYTLIYSTMRQLHDFSHEVLQPKEELMYRQLMQRDADDAEGFANIRDQHQHIRALSNRLLQQLDDISHGGKPARRDRLRPQLQQFIDAFRQHIDAEENEIFPTAEKQLLERDWYALQTGISYLESVNRDVKVSVAKSDSPPVEKFAAPARHLAPRSFAKENERVTASFTLTPLPGAYSLAETIGSLSECAEQLTKLSVRRATAGLNESLDEIMACRDTRDGVAELPVSLLRVTLHNASGTYREARQIVKKYWQRDSSTESRLQLR